MPMPELPMDVRLMNGVASGVFALAGIALAAAFVVWLTRAPVFTFRAVEIDGDLGRNSVATIRANALPRLKGNFFSLDLDDGRAAFESVPWVRRAVVRRVWPHRLAVRLEEHRPAAVWEGEDGNDRLVNSFGELFDANLGDVEEDGLPTLSGPDAQAAEVLAMYRRLQPLSSPLDTAPVALRLSNRGSWRVELDNGARVELGRGGDEEVAARFARFVRTLPEVTGRWGAPLEYADLRHADGYAVRLRGVTTTDKPKTTKTIN
jgi:cell division protein FtsQ